MKIAVCYFVFIYLSFFNVVDLKLAFTWRDGSNKISGHHSSAGARRRGALAPQLQILGKIKNREQLATQHNKLSMTKYSHSTNTGY